MDRPLTFGVLTCAAFVFLSGCKTETHEPLQLPAPRQVSPYSTLIIGNNYRGVAFSADYRLDSTITQVRGGRFTPTVQEVLIFERSLAISIDSLDQGEYHGPRIHGHLSDYYRQYFGLAGGNGERFLFVSFRWKDDEQSDCWMAGFPYTLVGGSHYWQAWFNLASDRFESIRVNAAG